MTGSPTASASTGACGTGISDTPEALRFALAHFDVTVGDLTRTLAAALEKGGDYADLFFEHTYSNSIDLRDGAVNRASSNVDFGMGVRVVAGDQTGYAYIEEITSKEMMRAAQTAARIAADNGRKTSSVHLTGTSLTHDCYRVRTSWEKVVVKDKMPFLQTLNDRIFAMDSRVTKVMAHLSDVTSHILFCNSEGQMYYDYRPMASLGAQCIMADGDRIENNYAARAFRMGGEFLTDELVETLAREAVDKTSILFRAVKPKGGEMPVVMGAGG